MTSTEATDPVVTNDPVVAFVYGALAYPSQRPALDTSASLVAGQSGPWTLHDRGQAAIAVALVDRFRTTPRLNPGLTPVEVHDVAIADRLLASCRDTSKALLEFVTAEAGVLPATLDHQVQSIDDRLRSFTESLTGWMATQPDPAGGDLPSAAEAVRWRLGEWIAFLRSHRLTPDDAATAVRAAAIEANHTPPARLRDVSGRLDLTELLLHWVAERLAAREETDRG